MQVPFYRHGLRAGDAAAVAAVLDGPMLTSGAVGRAVEEEIAAFFEVPHALLTNSWTNGAIATLLALGIGPGDEVIVPAMTFVATANVVRLVGATPVFVDVDPETLLVTPDAVVAALNERTRAVIPVHIFGQMADMPALAARLGPRGIHIIEDAAHCFEGQRAGARPGAYSDAAIFSFYATKNITCGEGGAVITRDFGLAARLRETRLHGMSAAAADRFQGGRYRHWDMVRLGTKANLPDLLAALLPAQIARVEARRARRETLARRYRDAFAGLPLRLPRWLPDCVHAHHLFPVAVAPAIRDTLLARLTGAGIGATVNYRAVPETAFYRKELSPIDPEERFPDAVRWGRGTLSLPLYPDLGEREQDAVIATLARLLQELDAAGARGSSPARTT